MNKRIKELYITAMREDCGEKWDTQEEFIERFAELIVRECIDIIDEEGSHEGGSIRSMKKIREHFGVEE